MLVTLGSAVSISGGASQTFQYACNSVQQVYIYCKEATGEEAIDGHLTIQIGNDVVCNDIDFQGLSLLSGATGGGFSSTTESMFKVDLGSHVLDGEENLYVTIRNSDASNAIDAIDVCAVVNEGGVYQPLKYTNYADSVFTDTNTLSVYAWSDSDMTGDTSAFTVRNQSYSSAPTVQSGTNVTGANSWVDKDAGHAHWKKLATMAQNQVPLNTSINYTSTLIDGVICISAMDKLPSKAGASRASGQAVLSAMTSAERKAL